MSKFLGRSSKSFMSSTSEANSCSTPSRESDDDTFFETSTEGDAQLHPDAHPDGGLACNNAALMKAQRGALVDVVKNLGKNLLTGNLDLLKVSLPVRIFETRSYLEKLADPWVFPHILDAAAAATDPVARLRWVATYFVAGFHRVFSTWQKPFNPVLGETWQACLQDGSHIFLEQISHHPPVSAYQLYGPEGRYVYNGVSEPSVTFGPAAISTSSKGTRTLRFADGGAVTVDYPVYDLKGILATGAPRAELSGCARFVDAANGLTASVRFGALHDASDPALARSDTLCGVIRRSPEGRGGGPPLDPTTLPRMRSDNGGGLRGKALRSLTLGALGNGRSRSFADPASDGSVVVASCCGNWLSHLDWDGERAWTLGVDPAQTWRAEPDPLPSDCRFRPDLAALLGGEADMQAAQVAKEALENQQRADAKLRRAGVASK